MLSRRLLSTPHTPSRLSRSFSISLAHQKTPSLADITPDGAPAFDARQKEFRDALKAAQKAKEQQDSQSFSISQSSSSSSSTSASTSDITGKLELGSLSTGGTEAAREAAFSQESSKRKGALSNLIYGTHEGRQMDKEIEKSFSQVLARGKYVHSIVMHQVKPDKVDEYIKLVGEWYPKMAALEENHVHLVGSWRTEVGDCDTFGMFTSLSPLRHQSHNADYFIKFTSGNINAITVIMPLSTVLPTIPTSLNSTVPLKPWLRTSKPRWCKNFPSGLRHLLAALVVSSNSAHILFILETYWNGKLIGAKDWKLAERLWKV